MVLRSVPLITFALLAISSTGCLFSGRPCVPGNWHYHSYGCRHTVGSGECQTCQTPHPDPLPEGEGNPIRPRMPTQTDSASNTAGNTVAAGVQKCSWQQPDDVSSLSALEANTPEETPRRGHATRDFGRDGSAKSSESDTLPSANDTPASKPQPVPYAWGYFGASGRW